ncbi:hypothetical protein SDRG_02013 [Saprolegnia diclina VS20]|uniref:Uncharacterized protein n=1 Tax=Saprolegnia diclina (strain VS20) TaxID=1156394 RepID=T0R3Q6_SAPDV|nr:hypothetical protein SDRG_02013 [Saprolegnia diclina VS20]EQC40950.1 hypothetical protein SDRG_02013 [Saprolegnia diclina VS20]|eukprot:XP_008605794.1 hypothetical protein SDRG_02013 [Saprolegnia diclina VS20]
MRVHIRPPTTPAGPTKHILIPRRHDRLVEVGGVLSVIVSIGLSLAAIEYIFTPYLATDYFVPHFASSAPVLVAAINNQLTLIGSGAIDVVSPNAAYLSSLDGTSPAYGRLLVYRELTTLLDGVRGLRRLATAQVVKMVTPYCWADLNKTWELAYTSKRQARCLQFDATNGAVHLETVLRNIDFQAFLDNTQGLFLSAIGQPIASSGRAGDTWLASLQSHVWVPERDEVALWAAHGLDRYTLQYGTGIGIGVFETISVETALGQLLSLPLKTILTQDRWTFRTTSMLCNLLYNDLYAIGANQSLVRHTTNYFGDINPSQIEAYVQGLPLRPVQQAIHDGLGPLGIIDAKWVPPPPRLLASVSAFRATLAAALVATPSLLGNDAARQTLYPTPARWSDTRLRFFTGSPMCAFSVPQRFVQQTFGFTDVCGSQMPLTLEWHALPAAYALWLLGPNAAHDVCNQSFAANATTCHRLVRDATIVYSATAQALPILDPSVVPNVMAINIGLLQILRMNDTSDITLDQQLLLSPDFDFLGWMYVYDWAIGAREVIALQGDAAAFTLVSALYAPIATNPILASAGLGPYLWYLATATTSTLVVLSLCLFVLRLRSSSPGNDWFQFTPLVASVYINRNLLVFRSLAAILCLGTAPLDASTTTNGITRLLFVPRTFSRSALLALESLWGVHIAHDVLLPLTGVWRALTPMTCLGWCIIVGMDQLVPPTLSTTLDRQCYTVNMDYTAYCNSGLVRVGSMQRCVAVLSVLFAAISATLLYSRLRHQRHNLNVSSALLPPMAPLHVSSTGHHVHLVSAVMCGLLPLTWSGHAYIFDVKLWCLLSRDDYAFELTQGTGSLVLPHCAPTSSPPTMESTHGLLSIRLIQRGLRLSGLCYIGLTLWSNTAYLGVLETSMANDFGWAGFNATGMHAFLANAFNRQLLTSTDAIVALHDPAFGDALQPYNGTATTVSWFPTVARRHLFNASVPLAELVAGLREMEPCQLPWMFTQYCWLDLARQWEMASTSTRQARCVASRGNGAVYLETSLRNVQDWDAWHACWGDSFDSGFGQDLQASSAGQAWLRSVYSNTLSVTDEVLYWRTHGISIFLLQWQNFKDLGLSDAMTIMTPFGLSYTLPISQRDGELHLAYQTTHRMYWAFASDLWAVSPNATSIGGKSLLRNSPRFAFANTSRASLLFENLTLASPLDSGLSALTATLGPFGAVDLVYVSCPRSLLDLYDHVLRAIATTTTTRLDAQSAFLSLPIKAYIGQVPRVLLTDASVRIVGGNLMCGADIAPTAPSSALDALFGIDAICSWWYLEYLTPSPTGLLFALLGFDAVHTIDPVVDWSAFCAGDVYAEANCADIYAASYAFASAIAFNTTLVQHLAAAAEADARALSIEVVQYLQRPNSSETELYQLNILDDVDRSWIFFGWHYLAEWVVGQREVVSFQGDTRTITAISRHSSPVTLALSDAAIPTRLSYVCQQCVRYVTGAMMLGAGVAAYYAIIICRGVFEGSNLFALNRLVGHAWIGRALLIVRGVTALWLLNTAPLDLVAFGAGARFEAPPVAWFPTLLAASELTWLVYIANDVFSCITRQYTPLYAWKSSVGASIAAAAWTIAAPQVYAASVRRSCTYVNMDLALHCISGYIEIGRLRNVWIDVALCLGCVLAGAVSERLYRPKLPATPVPSLLLGAASLYTLEMSSWVANGQQYIDRMSAAMAGLLTWRHDSIMYVFDIKSWRLFTVVPEAKCPFDATAVVALHRIAS